MFNKKNQNPKTILSHQQKMKKNPISWILIILICTIFLVIKILPDFFYWKTKSDSIKNFETKITNLENTNQTLKKRETKIEREFDSISNQYRKKESQIFPKKIDPIKIVKILELFALQLENLDTIWKDSHFKINKVSFGQSARKDEKTYYETPTTISFTSDEKNIKEFIKFLQTQKLPNGFLTGVDDGRIDPTALQFLKDNFLPISHIRSIKFLQTKDENNHISVQFEIIFFSNIK